MVYTDKIHGRVVLDEVFVALMRTPAMLRLQGIHQAGAMHLVDERVRHTRFDHSVGVMLLIRQLGGTIEEQIAGLLHDISHTAFSHLIDYVLSHEEEDFHERRYLEVLLDAEVIAVLQQHGFQVEQFADLEQYKLLEYPLPGLCADRIDYTLRDMLLLGQLNISTTNWLLAGLIVVDGRIVFNDLAKAQSFQQQYQYLVNEYFNGRINRRASEAMTMLIRTAMEQGDIDLVDFYDDDIALIKKIEKTRGINLSQLIHHQVMASEPLLPIQSKYRVIDPDVLINSQVKKLSEWA